MTWPVELECQTEEPATDDEIALFVDSVFAPLSESETVELVRQQKNILGDASLAEQLTPSDWQLPRCQLPDSYLDFLRFSNGGFFSGANRDLDPLFATREVREYMLAYSIPHWMPESCPIGFDGGGAFYLLDLRRKPNTSDYPILFAHAGNLGYDVSKQIAGSFAELIDTRLGGS